MIKNMILKRLLEYNRLHETVFMGVLSLFCFAVSIFRLAYTDTNVFLFLNWNLFLAFLPWAFSSLMVIQPKLRRSKWMFVVLLCSWLLFFPNAPYILTDLFHLRLTSAMPVWFDLVLILSFAWTGLLFGFLSLWDIEDLLRNRLKEKYVVGISVLLLFIGSFGIYIGRYLRWNSWDILTSPFQLLYDIGDRLVNPLSHPRTWGVTLLMGLFLNMLYFSFRLIRKRPCPEVSEDEDIPYADEVDYDGKRIFLDEEGLGIVEIEGRYGYIDKDKNLVIKAVYDDAYPFYNGNAPAKMNGKWGLIDKKGKYIIEPEYDDIEAFHEGLALVELHGKNGYINRQGEMVIPMVYDQASVFQNGQAIVSLDGKHFYHIDKQGRKIRNTE